MEISVLLAIDADADSGVFHSHHEIHCRSRAPLRRHGGIYPK
jgi:hypothetical protein